MKTHLDPLLIRSLTDLQRHINDEGDALRLFEWLRWPDGRSCPRCDSRENWTLKARQVRFYQCRGCGKQFSATTRTPLHGTKLPLATWLQAVFLIVSSRKGMSSLTLAQHLGITQRSAWKIGHAVHLMMVPTADESRLSGTVEVDYLADGGSPARKNRAKYGAKIASHIYNPPGRGSNKTRILVAVERGGRVRTSKMTNGTLEKVGPMVRAIVDPEAHLMTDGDKTLIAIGTGQRAHSSVNHRKKEFARSGAHVNTAEAFNLFLRRAKMGVWHSWSDEHLDRYLAEFQFHWDHRPTAIVDDAGKRNRRFVSVPSIILMRHLFSRCQGRELRRTSISGVETPRRKTADRAQQTQYVEEPKLADRVPPDFG